MSYLVYIYTAAAGIAFLSSLPGFRLDIFHYKIISTILFLDFSIELWSMVLVREGLSNVPMYNFNMLLEFWLYAYYYQQIIRNRKIYRLISIFLWILPAIWVVMVVFIFHIDRWNSHFFLTGCVVMIFLSAWYYYELFTAKELVKLSSNFEFWIATGLIIFYSYNLPYLGMLNFLNENFPELAYEMLRGLQILNIIFYLIFAYAYICVTHIKKS